MQRMPVWVTGGALGLLLALTSHSALAAGASPTPTSTALAGGTATVAPPATASPTATTAPTLQPTATPTAVATPLALTSALSATKPSLTTISSGTTQSANPGSSVSYTHTVTNGGTGRDTKAIIGLSSGGWTVQLFKSDGSTALTDTDADGIPDTGPLNAGQSTTIVVKVTVPAGTAAGVQDTVYITALSTASGADATGGGVAIATDVTKVNSVVTLSLSSSAVSFGSVSPAGEVDPSSTSVTSSTDASGAAYVKGSSDGRGSVRVTVTSNGPWTGSCSADENSGTASTIRVADGRLEWRLSGDATWYGLSTTANQQCFASRPTGSTTYGFDYRLHVAWTDDPGTVTTSVHYQVSR